MENDGGATPWGTSNPSRSGAMPYPPERPRKETSSWKTRMATLFLPRLYAKTRGHRRFRRENLGGNSRMQRSPNSRQLRPDAAKNTNPDQRHSETARWKNRTPPHMSSPRKRRESKTAQRREIRKPTNQYRYVSMPQKSMPAPGSNTPQQNRTNGNRRTRTKKLIGEIEKAPGPEKVELYHEKIENLLDNAAKHAGLTRTQYKCWKKAGIIDARKFARGRSKSK